MKFHPTVLAVLELADFYGITTIHMGIEVKEEKLIFTTDPVENQRKKVFKQVHVYPLSESGQSTVVK